MEDFNFDNQQIDQKFQEHVLSNLHLTEQQREQLGKDGRVLSQKPSISVEDGVLVLTVTAQCQENIGVLQEILFG